ncbi:MAG TPA: fused MFS/spermidine synthase [Verrucomicrobiae bacterium]|nr:fused MFS/spermidine synthase [Verrucomicrobiae bacterium]
MAKALIRANGWVFLLLFFGSGATALVYEVIWSKYLAQMLGSTVQAQTVVLAVFMGGLALGNHIFGRKADGYRTPVRVYGILEFVIGLYAFTFPNIYSLADHAFVALGTGMLEKPLLLLCVKTVLSIALLLGPTILMGGTLPLLAAWLQNNFNEAGRGSALFYGVNSLGAVAGSCAAGFYLIQTWGLVAGLQMTALLNVLIGGTAFILGRHQTLYEHFVAQAAPLAPAPKSAMPSKALKWASLVVAITGGVSMGLEVLASRSLALIFGSSVQAFAIVLMAFILGIGLGSAVIAAANLQPGRSEKLLVIVLLAASAWVGVLVFNIEGWVEFYRMARTGIARTSTGYIYNQWLSAFLAMLVLGVPAALIGSVLPLMMRVIAQDSGALGVQVGRLLTSNTLGAVFGVLLTGFLVMPQAGLRNAFVILALGLCVMGGVLVWRRFPKFALVCPGAVTAGLVAVLLFGGEGWKHTISSGVFRSREREFDKDFMAGRKKAIDILFYEDAPDATVSVERRTLPGLTNLALRINGKPDASSYGDLCPQLLVAHIPMFARPQSKDVFLLGMGTGISASAVVAHPIDQLVLAENCKPVLRAAEFFKPWNRDVLHNPKLKLVYEDARTVLKLTPQKFDVVIAEPSNPWTVGVGSVFSKEFYELAASKLKPGGIMAQWFHVYEIHDDIVTLVLRTFADVFPHFEIWDCNDSDIVMVGSLQPWESSPETYKEAILRDEPFRDLQRVGINSPLALFARQLASQGTSFAIPGEGAIQQDWMPLLEYHAPKAFFLGTRSHLLGRFDERTWQQYQAPAWKRNLFPSLSDADLRSIFRRDGSVNDDLMYYVRNRLATNNSAYTIAETPNIFRPANLAANVRTNEPAQVIKASLNKGDNIQAKALLEDALKAKPDDVELQYLSRLIARPSTL